jgi:basic membrane lipoprotein Med (substrate-binding protein (PBP1-ABC) superfamily)
MLKNHLTTIAAGAMLGLLAACAGEKAGTTADSTGTKKMRVALLTPGPISDKSWNGIAHEGLLAIRDSLGAETSHIQTKTPAEFDENFRQYGAQGYDLVIGNGFEYQEAATRVAPSYPNTKYAITSGRVTATNVAGLAFAFEEASYQAGMIAGAITKSNKIGVRARRQVGQSQGQCHHVVPRELGGRQRRQGTGTGPDRTGRRHDFPKRRRRRPGRVPGGP